MDFKEIKSEILKRAKEKNACVEEYKKAYLSKSMQDLCNIIKNNFYWCINNSVLTIELLEENKELFAENQIYCNINASSGYCLASDSATVEASGSATVEASGSVTVRAYDSVTVEAWGSATVRAYDSVTVRAYDSVTVEASGSAYIYSNYIVECKLSDNAIYRLLNENKIFYVSDSIVFEKQYIDNQSV